MNAIVALIRGHKNWDNYDSLIQRNAAIEEFFGDKYPVLLFHEGNIGDPREQAYIKNHNPDMDIQFHSVADRWAGGYEGMCRFNMWDIWDVCQHYENILRIDDDCYLTEMTEDPFDQIGDNVYLKSCFWAESHTETNATLPGEIERLTGVSRSVFYDDNKFVYTNVGLSKPSFWRSGEVSRVLGALSFHPEQRRQRWGDLPVLGSLLHVYAPDRIGTLTGMKYFHASHNVEIVCQ